MDKEASERIFAVMTMEGWRDIEAMLDEQIAEHKDGLYRQMIARPETLTGRKCLLAAGSVRALEDFRESLQDAVKPFTRNPLDKDRD